MDTEAVARTMPLPAGRPEIRVPSVLRCGFMIFVVKVMLKTRGFGRTIRWIRRRVNVTPETVCANLERVKATEYAVALAGALYPGRALCLEQSLALYWLLRQQRVRVRYCQGVQAHPFLAHAWVEYRGEPINDVMEHVNWFARLPDELP
jgi:hypothetical protein